MKVYLAQFVGQRDDKISPAGAPVLKLRRCTPEAISAGGADGIIALSARPKERVGPTKGIGKLFGASLDIQRDNRSLNSDGGDTSAEVTY